MLKKTEGRSYEECKLYFQKKNNDLLLKFKDISKKTKMGQVKQKVMAYTYWITIISMHARCFADTELALERHGSKRTIWLTHGKMLDKITPILTFGVQI